MKAETGPDKEILPGEGGLFPILLIFFAVTSLATTEFIKDSFPSWDALRPPKLITVYLIFIVQVLPAFALVGVDRLIAWRYGTGRYLRIFRRIVFSIALLMIMRQVQLYWDPATDFADDIRSASVVYLVLLDLAVLGAIVALVTRAYRGVLMFFYYMSPIAIATTAIIAFQIQTDDEKLPTYAEEVTTVAEGDERPPVFIIVFDGLGYDVMQDEGALDRTNFPNTARLADSGVYFSNATSNYFWSIDSVPTVVEPARVLTNEYNVRLYTQYPVLERRYLEECGKTITCRGVRYLTETAPLRVASNLALRTFYQTAPEAVESVISRPMGWFLDRVGWVYPSADRAGWQMFTKRQFGAFMADIDAEEAQGRLYILHLMLPHHPIAFDEDGDARDSIDEPFPEAYRRQSMFADKLLGEFLDRLEDEGLFDESVVIVTSDHGPRTVVPSVDRPPAEETPRIPFVVHAPSLGVHGVVSDVDYEHIDFAATLADVLDLPKPTGAGVSAFSEARPTRVKTFENRGARFWYSEDEGWQLIQ